MSDKLHRRAVAALAMLIVPAAVWAQNPVPVLDFTNGAPVAGVNGSGPPGLTSGADAKRLATEGVRALKAAYGSGSAVAGSKAVVTKGRVSLDFFSHPPSIGLAPASGIHVPDATVAPSMNAADAGVPSKCRGRDIVSLLSPECLSTLAVPVAPSPPSSRDSSTGVACTYAFVSAAHGGFSASVSASSAVACVDTAIRLTAGMAGRLNIVTSDEGSGVVAVGCVRDDAELPRIRCHQVQGRTDN